MYIISVALMTVSQVYCLGPHNKDRLTQADTGKAERKKREQKSKFLGLCLYSMKQNPLHQQTRIHGFVLVVCEEMHLFILCHSVQSTVTIPLVSNCVIHMKFIVIIIISRITH